jgi:hypothetical protein
MVVAGSPERRDLIESVLGSTGIVLQRTAQLVRTHHVRNSFISSSPGNKMSTTTMILFKRSACSALPLHQKQQITTDMS